MEQLYIHHEQTIPGELAHEASQRLVDAGLTFGVFSGSHAALLGGHRTTQDTDFWVRNGQEEALIAAFPEAQLLDRRFNQASDDSYDGVLLTLGDQAEVGIMIGSIIQADGITYPSPFSDTVASRLTWQTLGGLTTWFVDPADTLLFKAISQRGREVSKHDIVDIIAIAQSVTIDKTYLMTRIEECHAWQRVVPLLLHLEVLTSDDLRSFVINA